MSLNRPHEKRIRFGMLIAGAAAVLAPALAGGAAARAEDNPGKSFVDTFDKFDRGRWFISDGWTNGDYQNCSWSKQQVKVKDGILRMTFDKRQTEDREHVCGEIQTRQRFGYGTFEVRMKAAAGSGLNSAFFTYIGPVDKEPHDEIDFEVLGKDPSKVQLNQYVNGKSVGEEKLVPVPGGADQGFHDYAFVWEKDRIRWYIDGEQVGEATDPAKIPTHPGKIFASLWGTDKLTSWLGTFSDLGGPVTAEIDRIAYTAPGEACQFPESIACMAQSQ
jgi:endo-1,3-1,4-beta-glycanase ExoK